jgi:hypothetical protein
MHMYSVRKMMEVIQKEETVKSSRLDIPVANMPATVIASWWP